MSDEIVHKAFENSKITDDERWFAHVRDYGIFNDAQVRLIADPLIDVQVRAREECKQQVTSLQDALVDFLQDNVLDELRRVRSELGVARERVAMLEGQIKAMTDLKGVPGKRRETGKKGEKGARGAQGEVGPPGSEGRAAPHWIRIKTEGFDLITVLSDGTLGPRISLQKMFETFVRQV